MAYSVAQRTKEIGIRMALGAIPRQILAMVLREASSLSAAAIALGAGASLLVTRFVKSMLFGVAPSDPATVCGAAVLLLIVALGASWIPARRAASVQPMEALRRDWPQCAPRRGDRTILCKKIEDLREAGAMAIPSVGAQAMRTLLGSGRPSARRDQLRPVSPDK
jgi:predicted lysophospholipase L1 biosynthesis ABC-type transport system permease subunit